MRRRAKIYAARQWAVLLDDEPVPIWSSEHYRVHAKIAHTWAERVASLRRRVDLDYGNLQARCDLAAALVDTGGRDEAAALYLDLVSTVTPPCSPTDALSMLESQDQKGTHPSPATPSEQTERSVFPGAACAVVELDGMLGWLWCWTWSGVSSREKRPHEAASRSRERLVHDRAFWPRPSGNCNPDGAGSPGGPL